MNWKLNKILYPVYNLGEGRRIGIWVQGCSLRCKGCVNKTLWNKKGGKNISVIELFNWIVSLQENFEGVTLTGGEPFQQYEQLIAFLHLIKTKTRLKVHCFSGYYLSELTELFTDRLFFRYIDTLIDGRYLKELHEDSNLKGSVNQTVYNFIDGNPVIQDNITVSKKWSISVGIDNQIYMAGIPKKNELDNICVELSKVGLHKKFR